VVLRTEETTMGKKSNQRRRERRAQLEAWHRDNEQKRQQELKRISELEQQPQCLMCDSGDVVSHDCSRNYSTRSAANGPLPVQQGARPHYEDAAWDWRVRRIAE
jgi:hypothetical protein